MNTITNVASASTTILAIDLGKYKSVACVHDQTTGEYAFTTFETTRAELHKLVGKELPVADGNRNHRTSRRHKSIVASRLIKPAACPGRKKPMREENQGARS